MSKYLAQRDYFAHLINYTTKIKLLKGIIYNKIYILNKSTKKVYDYNTIIVIISEWMRGILSNE